LSSTIGFFGVTTDKIGTAGTPRVHAEDQYASAFGLAGHEDTQLKERRTVTVCLANLPGQARAMYRLMVSARPRSTTRPVCPGTGGGGLQSGFLARGKRSL